MISLIEDAVVERMYIKRDGREGASLHSQGKLWNVLSKISKRLLKIQEIMQEIPGTKSWRHGRVQHEAVYKPATHNQEIYKTYSKRVRYTKSVSYTNYEWNGHYTCIETIRNSENRLL